MAISFTDLNGSDNINRTALLIAFAFICGTLSLAHPNHRGHHGGHHGGGKKCGRKRCHDPEICVNKKCILPAQVGKGESCDGQETVCKNNLVCDEEAGLMTYKRARGRGKSCADATTEICKPKFVCENNGDDGMIKTCKKKRGTYMPCGTTEWTCKDNLVCTDDKKLCAKTVAEGKTCDDLGKICGEGFSCTGDKGSKACTEVPSEPTLTVVGQEYNCGDLTFRFIFDGKPNVFGAVRFREYEYAFDAVARTATGTAGFQEEDLGCAPGGPLC